MNMENRSYYKQLLLLAVPTFGQLIAEPAFVLIDTAIVGHVSDSALAGLSLGSTVVLAAVGLCVFLAYSTTSQVARLFGADKKREGFQAGVNSLWLSLLIGVALAAGLFVLAEPICAALGGKGDDLAQAVIYTQAVVLGVPGMLLVYASNGIFRGMQKVTITLVAAVSGAVLNTVLDVLFVIVWGWGIAGSGVATCIAQWFMGCFLLVPSIRWAMQAHVTLVPQLRSIVSAGSDGFPLFLRTLALRVAIVATVMAAASMGTQVLAGYQVVNAAWGLMVNALDSVAIAGQALVGTHLGASHYDKARELTRVTSYAGLGVGVVAGAVFALAGAVVGPFFTPSHDIQILVTAGMAVIGISLPLQGWMFALDGILIGAGDYRYLARSLGAVSVVYLLVLAVFALVIAPFLGSDLASIVGLWFMFGFVLMGGRGIANMLRVRGDAWMKVHD